MLEGMKYNYMIIKDIEVLFMVFNSFCSKLHVYVLMGMYPPKFNWVVLCDVR